MMMRSNSPPAVGCLIMPVTKAALGVWWPALSIPMIRMWRGPNGGTCIRMKTLICPYIPEPATDPMTARLRDGIEATTTTDLTRDQIIAARRAYYANVSYFDSKVGALVQTVAEMGQADNTLIIVTADHGDMLGERGLWYKMSMYDRSVRVPLIMAGPGVAQGTTARPVSLLDVMPTLLDYAGGDTPPHLEGRSLRPLAEGRGGGGPDHVLIEYCAEMTAHPVLAIRKGAYKYVTCTGDPDQLFDLTADPEELVNLVGDPACAKVLADMRAMAAETWDAPSLDSRVRESQRNRQVLNTAMQMGNGPHWDYNPPSDASQQYVRNHMDWTIAADRFRFPPKGG